MGALLRGGPVGVRLEELAVRGAHLHRRVEVVNGSAREIIADEVECTLYKRSGCVVGGTLAV